MSYFCINIVGHRQSNGGSPDGSEGAGCNMYTCIYMYIYEFIHIYVYTCTPCIQYIYINTYIYTIRVYMHIHIHVRIKPTTAATQMFVCIHVSRSHLRCHFWKLKALCIWLCHHHTYLYIHIYTYAYFYVYMYSCLCVCVWLWFLLPGYIYIYICTHTYICKHAYICIYTCIYVYVLYLYIQSALFEEYYEQQVTVNRDILIYIYLCICICISMCVCACGYNCQDETPGDHTSWNATQAKNAPNLSNIYKSVSRLHKRALCE